MTLNKNIQFIKSNTNLKWEKNAEINKNKYFYILHNKRLNSFLNAIELKNKNKNISHELFLIKKILFQPINKQSMLKDEKTHLEHIDIHIKKLHPELIISKRNISDQSQYDSILYHNFLFL